MSLAATFVIGVSVILLLCWYAYKLLAKTKQHGPQCGCAKCVNIRDNVRIFSISKAADKYNGDGVGGDDEFYSDADIGTNVDAATTSAMDHHRKLDKSVEAFYNSQL